jgi:hypothetical protein
MAKRQTVILYLEDDPVVAAAKQVILDEAGKFFDLIALLPVEGVRTSELPWNL